MRKRKITAWALVLCMLFLSFGGVPMQSFADNGSVQESVQINTITPEELISPQAGQAPAQTGESSLAGAESVTESRLASLLVHTGTTPSDTNVLLKNTGDSYSSTGVTFDPAVAGYALPLQNDTVTQLRFRPVTEETGAAVTLHYEDPTTGAMTSKPITWSSGNSTWANCLKAGKNHLSLVVTPPAGSTKSAVTYTLDLDVAPTLTSLSVLDAGRTVALDKSFTAATTGYAVNVNTSTTELTIEAAPRDTAYQMKYNGQDSKVVSIASASAIQITVTAGGSGQEVGNSYVVTLNKLTAYTKNLAVTPSDAVVRVTDASGQQIKRSISGLYEGLLPGETYTYTVTKKGYMGVRGTFTDESPLNISLTKASEPAKSMPNYTGDWINFRGNDANMGLTAAPTARNATEASLKWAKKYGTGWAAAPTPPIIVNDTLYIAMNNQILKIDKKTGEKLMESQAMAGKVGFALNPITYGEGMLFVPIGNGQIQALRADTLESIWISEKLTGQTLCPVTYKNGYIYNGTWNSETREGSYFCLSVTDEDPSRTDETKYCTWKLDHKGGFYWAGAYATDNYVIFGSDDGTSEGDYTANGILYSVDPVSGKTLDTIEGVKGDIRSTIAYDKKTDAIYCTTKGGKFIKVHVNADGTFDDSTYKIYELGGMSTGTPLIYEGVAFLGASGPSQFSPTGHSYKIVDARTMELIASIDTIPGYVQTSALLSTAYAQKTGKVYVYITYNYNPGGIYVIEYDVNTRTASGSHLFLPEGNLAQYCICSLVCDADGTIYYKNDSCYLMAVENTNAAAWKPQNPGDNPGGGGKPSNGGGTGAGEMEAASKATVTQKEDINGNQVSVATAAIGITAATDKEGRAAVNVTQNNLVSALNLAASSAQKAGEAGNANVVPEVKLEIKADGQASQIAVVIPAEGIRTLSQGSGAQLTISSPLGEITFDSRALSMINDTSVAGKNIELSISRKSLDDITSRLVADRQKLLKDAIGDRPLFELSVQTSDNQTISNFGKGTVTASFPYVLKAGEVSAGLTVYHVGEQGNLSDMEARYNAAEKKMLMNTNHFSYYAIGYDSEKAAAIQSPFSDVKKGVWYYEPVIHLWDRGILQGRAQTLFAPGENITRAEVVSLLFKMSGDKKSEAKNKFADVKGTAWYAEAVIWAADKGIAKGTGDTQFTPNANISRQDLAVMLSNYAAYKNMALEKKADPADFADQSTVASYAGNAVSRMQQAEIINGVKGGDERLFFYPKNNATRAETAKMIFWMVK